MAHMSKFVAGLVLASSGLLPAVSALPAEAATPRAAPVVTTVEYTGDTVGARDWPLTLRSTVTPASDSECGGSVGYTITPDPLDGEGSLTVSGAVGSSVLVTPMVTGTYELSVAYNGDDTCASSSSASTIIVGRAGTEGVGRGVFLDNERAVAFRHDVRRVIDDEGRALYRGRVTMRIGDGYQLTSHVRSSSVIDEAGGWVAGRTRPGIIVYRCEASDGTRARCATWRVRGTLSHRKGDLWVPIDRNVRATVTVVDAGRGGCHVPGDAACRDAFGIEADGSVAMYFPSGSPHDIERGHIHVR